MLQNTWIFWKTPGYSGKHSDILEKISRNKLRDYLAPAHLTGPYSGTGQPIALVWFNGGTMPDTPFQIPQLAFFRANFP